MTQKDERKENKSKREIFKDRMQNSIISSAMMMDHVLPGQVFMNKEEKKKLKERTEYGTVGIDENAYSINEKEKNEY